MIIALMGKYRSGKDTAADYLVERHGFIKAALAEPVYALATELFGMQEKDRKLLIEVGTKLREIDPLVWCNHLWKRVVGNRTKNRRIVVTDVRQLDEYRFFIMQEGLSLVRIQAPKDIREQRDGYSPEFELEPTETALDNMPSDLTVFNDGPLPWLHVQLDCLVEALEKREGIRRL